MPYMIIRSPGAPTPTLIASAAASIVPTITGVPSASPVADAASRVTVPAMSVVQPISGSHSAGPTPSSRSFAQARAERS